MKNFRIGQKVVFMIDDYKDRFPVLHKGAILTIEKVAADHNYWVQEFPRSSIYPGFLEALPEAD